MCQLVLLDISSKEIADLMCISQNSVGKTKARIAQKLHTTSAGLRTCLLELAR